MKHSLSMEKGRVGVPDGQGKEARLIVDMVETIRASLTKKSLEVLTELSRRQAMVKREPDVPLGKPLVPPRLSQEQVRPAGAGGQGKDATMVVAMVGIIALSIAMPAMIGSLGVMGAIIATTPGVAGALVAATSIGLTLALSGLIPAPLPRRALPQPARELKEVA